MELEQMADNVLSDLSSGRLRLWLTSLRDAPETFGEWAGLVRLRAEQLSGRWQPDRPILIQYLQQCAADKTIDGDPVPPGNLLLPLAADTLERDLIAMGVPKDLAAKARGIFTFDPPVAQWKI
ncbi:MAG TPA: hypothetical protein VN541_14645 [Tepidisphaeraceae bacterium]|nr:hypothetical protein [Tepidisphaeraceae bacterium]